MESLRGLRVLVVGDAMLDTYLTGPAGRLCQEAPVPVVAVDATSRVPGGAGNVAANAVALGADVHLVGGIGDDWEAEVLLACLEEAGVGQGSVYRRAGRATLAKTRVLAGGHMVVRFDQGTTAPVAPDTESLLVEAIEELVPCDAVLVADYGYGTMTPAVVDAIRRRQADSPAVLAVDAKDLSRYRGAAVTVAKPNYAQAATMLGGLASAPGATAERAREISAGADRLLDRCDAGMVAVTLDREGALILERGRPPYRTYARPGPQIRAAGAGDTFLTALALGLAAGNGVPEAAEVAAAAAGVVLGKAGTATCTGEEILETTSGAGKILDEDRLAGRMAFLRGQGARIVLTSGCFDLLHRGHISYLSQAKALGDVLVVGLNSDASVSRLKGSGRPISRFEDRAAILAALSCVDYVAGFAEDDPRRLVGMVQPHVFTKGGDYEAQDLIEAPEVEAHGGVVHILGYETDQSTTGIIQRIAGQPAGARAPR